MDWTLLEQGLVVGAERPTEVFVQQWIGTGIGCNGKKSKIILQSNPALIKHGCIEVKDIMPCEYIFLKIFFGVPHLATFIFNFFF
jgi:hypothetical protein